MKMSLNSGYLCTVLGLMAIFLINNSSCDKSDLTLSEIRQKVAEAVKLDYLEMLLEKLKTRTQRLSRSSKRNIWSPFFSNLASKAYKNKRRGNRNRVGGSREWNRDVKSTLRKYWQTYIDPYYHRRNFPLININTPSVRRACRLVNRLHRIVVVTKDSVYGANNRKSSFSKLQIESVGFGAVMIKGTDANSYICMKEKDGKVYSTAKKSLECVFIEKQLLNHYQTYQAFLHRKHHSRWFLAINSDGETINGRRSKFFKKSSQFLRLPLRL